MYASESVFLLVFVFLYTFFDFFFFWLVCDKTPRHVKRQIPIFPLNPPATLTTTTSSTGSCISSSSSSGGGSSSSCNRLTFSPPPPKPRAVCVFIGFPYSSPPRPRCRQNNSRFPANRPFGIYIYTYIVCVHVCVCVCQSGGRGNNRKATGNGSGVDPRAAHKSDPRPLVASASPEPGLT